jgi:hypothetical protein
MEMEKYLFESKRLTFIPVLVSYGNESMPAIPVGKTDWERTVNKIPGAKLISYSFNYTYEKCRLINAILWGQAGRLCAGKTLGESAYEPPTVSLRRGVPENVFQHTACLPDRTEVFYWAYIFKRINLTHCRVANGNYS